MKSDVTFYMVFGVVLLLIFFSDKMRSSHRYICNKTGFFPFHAGQKAFEANLVITCLWSTEWSKVDLDEYTCGMFYRHTHIKTVLWV